MKELIEELKKNLAEQEGQKPSEYLVHFVGGDSPDYEALEEIKGGAGLLVEKGNNWERINDQIPNRPRGIFFWGEDDPRMLSNRLEIAIADLDTDKLYAFPAALADAVAQVNAGIYKGEIAEAILAVAAEFEAVPYAEFAGEFAAEWIYTEDVAVDFIKFS